MERIELRYSGSENGAGLVASSLFAIAGLGFIAFLVMKAGTDPKALWLGPQVKNPLLANLILGGIAGAVSLAAAAMSVYFARRVFDRTIQLVLDDDEISDHAGKAVAWTDVKSMKPVVVTEKHGSPISAGLVLVTNSGQNVTFNTFQLQQHHDDILEAAQRRWKKANRQERGR